MQFVTPSRALALAMACVLAGCSSGSSSSSGNAVAGVTSSAAPNPGGQAALGTASNPVTATLSTDAYATFKESVSISDLVIPDLPALSDRAFVVEDDGTLRILDLSGSTPSLDRAVPLYSTALPGGSATGKLRVQDAGLAMITTSGGTAEGVALFDPLAASAPADVTTIPLGALTTSWPPGTLDSAGVDVSGQSLPVNFTADAVAAGGNLFVASSNLNTTTWANNPGTLAIYAFDRATRSISGGQFVQTSDFNPTGITLVNTPQGEVLLVTNSGSFGSNACSIDVLDPVAKTIVGTIPFPATGPSNPVDRLAVSPDGRRAYVGSQSAPAVFVLDLEDIGLELGNASTADLSARFLGGYTLNATSASSFISSVALSHTGNYLYAANFNESALHVIDLLEESDAGPVSGFARTGDVTAFEGLLNRIAVRPGVPGVNFAGPSIYAMTINLAAADRTLTNVSVTLDTVEVDRH